MSDKIASLWAEIGVNASKLDAGLKQTKAALKTTEAEMKATGAATDGLKAKTDGAAESNKGFASSAGLLDGVMKATAITGIALTAGIVGVTKALQAAKVAAEEMGRTDVVGKFDGMAASAKGAKEAILSIPLVAGGDFLDWTGAAVDALGAVNTTLAVSAVKIGELTGALSKQAAAAEIAKIANGEYMASVSKMGDAEQARKALEEQLRAQQRAGYEKHLMDLQAGYRNHLTLQIEASKVASGQAVEAQSELTNRLSQGISAFAASLGSMVPVINKMNGLSSNTLAASAAGFLSGLGIGNNQPGRAGGGPVMVGQSYNVNELKGQNEWFTPSVAGQVSQGPIGGGGGGGGDINITIQAGAFLGARDDAHRLGEQLVPTILHALQKRGLVRASPMGYSFKA